MKAGILTRCCIAFALTLSLVISQPAIAKPLKVVGWISFKPDRKHSHKVRVTARAYSRSPMTGRYFFSLIRKGGGGNAHSNQSGSFSTNGQRATILSRTTINLPSTGKFKARLVLLVRGEVVFTAVLDNLSHF